MLRRLNKKLQHFVDTLLQPLIIHKFLYVNRIFTKLCGSGFFLLQKTFLLLLKQYSDPLTNPCCCIARTIYGYKRRLYYA